MYSVLRRTYNECKCDCALQQHLVSVLCLVCSVCIVFIVCIVCIVHIVCIVYTPYTPYIPYTPYTSYTIIIHPTLYILPYYETGLDAAEWYWRREIQRENVRLYHLYSYETSLMIEGSDYTLTNVL